MKRYIAVRELTEMPSEEEFDAMSRRSIAANDQLGVRWVKSYYSAEEGKCYCEFEAPNAELIWEASRMAQLPLSSVSPISDVVDPDMFR